MTYYEKYFGNVEKAAETLEKILFGQIDICRDLCNFKNNSCEENELLDNYSCNHGIKYFLQNEINKKEEK